MYTLELIFRSNPAPAVIQVKEEEAAEQCYQQVLGAIQSGQPETLELTCDRTSKKVFVRTQELASVQLTPKAGSISPMGARTGFVAAES